MPRELTPQQREIVRRMADVDMQRAAEGGVPARLSAVSRLARAVGALLARMLSRRAVRLLLVLVLLSGSAAALAIVLVGRARDAALARPRTLDPSAFPDTAFVTVSLLDVWGTADPPGSCKAIIDYHGGSSARWRMWLARDDRRLAVDPDALSEASRPPSVEGHLSRRDFARLWKDIHATGFWTIPSIGRGGYVNPRTKDMIVDGPPSFTLTVVGKWRDLRIERKLYVDMGYDDDEGRYERILQTVMQYVERPSP